LDRWLACSTESFLINMLSWSKGTVVDKCFLHDFSIVTKAKYSFWPLKYINTGFSGLWACIVTYGPSLTEEFSAYWICNVKALSIAVSYEVPTRNTTFTRTPMIIWKNWITKCDQICRYLALTLDRHNIGFMGNGCVTWMLLKVWEMLKSKEACFFLRNLKRHVSINIKIMSIYFSKFLNYFFQ